LIDNHTLAFLANSIGQRFLRPSAAPCVVVVGSYAYPEFARSDSDLDLLIVSGDIDAEHLPLTILERIALSDRKHLVEARLFTAKQFRQYALTCDLAKLYGFVRGFRFISNHRADVEESVQLALNRYWTDNLRVYGALRCMDVAAKIGTFRFQFSDAANYMRDQRIAGFSTLLRLRQAELIRDFIQGIWTIFCAQEAQRREVLRGCDHNDTLLASIGLLRVFNEIRGARIIDYQKYSVPEEVVLAVQALDNGTCSTPEDLLGTMDEVFHRLFKLSLLYSSAELPSPVLWTGI
jgi:hypothetical protein